MEDWFEDTSFWVELYPIIFSDERFEIAEQQVEQTLALTGFQGGQILDLCCGPGRHSIELAKRGLKVTAVDRMSFLLDKASRSAAALGLEIEFVQEDMRHFIRPDAFSLALSLFTSFGYFDDKDEDFKVLRNLYESLQAGGVLMIDVMGKEILAGRFESTTCSQTPDGALFIERREIYDDWTRIRNEWILVKDGAAKSFKFHHTVYSGQELKELLRRAGFEEVKLFGDLSGSEYGAKASRLVAVARKAR